MGALQYVDVPGYHALIIRKTLSDAKKPGSILFRSREWLANTPAKWVADENAWYFPTGGAPAVLKFGKLANVGDAFDYQGSDYAFLGYDELTHFYQTDFEYVTSRLRRGKCPYHDLANGEEDPECKTCNEYGPLYRIPLRIRTASNPGGMGHLWVKRRYRIEKVPGLKTPNGRQLYRGTHPTRPHIPAFIDDNPFLDREDYVGQLEALEDPVTREQLLSGDWGVSEDGRFKQSWVGRYKRRENYYELPHQTFHLRELRRFLIVDPAASRHDTPGRQELTKKLASYTACIVFGLTPDGHMLVLDAERHQKEAPDTREMIQRKGVQWDPLMFTGMELSSLSTHMYQMLQNSGFGMRAFSPHTGDKIARSVDIANRMYSGRVWFPEYGPRWLQDLEDELWTWTGHPAETDDWVDCMSYGGIYMTQECIGIQSAVSVLTEHPVVVN